MQGGVGAHCRELARALTEAGQRVSLYSAPDGHSADGRVGMAHDRHGWGWRSLRAVAAWARDERLDVVNLHFQTAMYGMSPWVHFLPDAVRGVPVVTTFHDLRFPYLFPKAGVVRTWIVNRLARASDAVISTNHEDALALAQICPTVPLQLIPIGSSVRTDLPYGFSAAGWRAAQGVPDGALVVAHFGFINHSKGIEVLLRAVATLRQQLPVVLWMVGGRTGASDPTNAAFAADIDRMVEGLGLADVVHWSGFVDDETASAYLTACDVVALPFLDGASYRRSSLMAAIAHGCAILTTAPAVTIPPFRHAENLWLVNPSDEVGLAEALGVLGRDDALREALQAGARELRRWFDWAHIAQANLDCFSQTVERSTR